MHVESQMAGQQNQESEWPAEAGLILSALEAGGWKEERRAHPRMAYRVQAALRLFIDSPGSEQRAIYTRDAHSRGLGFVTTHRLPLGYGGTVQIMAPNQKMITVQCTLLRCRQAAPGWYEGALHFVRDQGEFAPPPEEA
jgi:hypothetical protein